MSFSKKIVVWAILFVTLITAGCFICWWHKGAMPDQLIDLSGIVITGVIVTYSAKAGAENYQKIKINNGGNENV